MHMHTFFTNNLPIGEKEGLHTLKNKQTSIYAHAVR